VPAFSTVALTVTCSAADRRGDETLKFEFDAGTQTRLLNFDRSKPAPAEKSWQGFSLAQWEGSGVGRGAPVDVRVTGGGILSRGVPGGGGQGLRGGPPPRQQAEINSGGDLRIVTTNFREGYLRKNGVPYSSSANITEYFDKVGPEPNGDVILLVRTVVEDPKYLQVPFITSTHFKLEKDGAKWNPSPCRIDPPVEPGK